MSDLLEKDIHWHAFRENHQLNQALQQAIREGQRARARQILSKIQKDFERVK